MSAQPARRLRQGVRAVGVEARILELRGLRALGQFNEHAVKINQFACSETLNISNTEFFDQQCGLLGFNVLGDGLQIHDLGDLDDRCDHGFRNPVGRYIPNETTVDFKRVDLEIL